MVGVIHDIEFDEPGKVKEKIGQVFSWLLGDPSTR